jgi:YD repeat-containing protein
VAQSARRALVALFALLLLGGFPQSAWPQQPRIHYVYDDLGRLVGVVDQDGNAATYTYDAVGNILAIGRHNVADTPGPVAITLVAPNKGKVGTAVSIFGRGFSADAAQNAISFSGAIATVTAATTNSLTTSVPPGAFTGPITVTTALGSATSPEPFRVLGLLTISPAGAVLVPNGTQQFTALEGASPTTDITWAVNGVPGGDGTVGTIFSGGLYAAPATVPSPPTVTVTATLLDDTTVSASATIAILAPQPLAVTALGVSVGVAAPTFSSVNSLVAPAVSVSFVAPAAVSPLVAPAVSVQMAPP